jgi:dienelactone hydrolase
MIMKNKFRQELRYMKNKKRIFGSLLLLIGFMLLFMACSPKPVQTESVRDNALRLVNELNAGNYDKAYRNFQYEGMKLSLSPGVFKDLWTDLIEEYGEAKEILSSSVNAVDRNTTVSIVVQHEKAPIIVNVIYNEKNRIAGLEYGVLDENVDWTKIDDQTRLAPNETLLTVGTDRFPLNAMLSVPKDGNPPYPLVILIPGSGPLDMDATVGVCTPFKDIAELLNERGIAVLRYNNRPYEHLDEIGKNIADFTPYEEIIEDAITVFQDAKELPEIDPERIFLAGHSIGGYFLPKIAESTEDCAGYIMLAANSYNLEDLIYQQYRYIARMDGKVTLGDKFVLARYQNMTKRVKNLKEGAKTNPKKLYGVYPNYWLYANKYNALEAAKKIEKPILFLQGTRDYQVSMDNFNLWKSTMEGKNNAKFIHYENLNHLFMYGDSPSTPYEYSTKKTVEPSVADDIADWIKEVAE